MLESLTRTGNPGCVSALCWYEEQPDVHPGQARCGEDSPAPSFSFDWLVPRCPTPMFRAQMLVDLPAGAVVDHAVRELIMGHDGDPYAVPWGPVPTNVSDRVLAEDDDIETVGVARTAFLAGARRPDVVRRLVGADLPGMAAWAVAANPIAVDAVGEVARVPHALPPGASERKENLTVLLRLVGAVLDGVTVNSTAAGLLLPKDEYRDEELGITLEGHWPWASLTSGQAAAVRRLSVFLAEAWEYRASRIQEAMSSNPDRDNLWMTGKWFTSDAILADEVLAELDELDGLDLVRPRDLGFGRSWSTGLSQMPSWMPGVLDLSGTAQWRELQELKPVAGRHVGRRLFKITGDDPGLWSVTVEMLNEWGDSLSSWLKTVESL